MHKKSVIVALISLLGVGCTHTTELHVRTDLDLIGTAISDVGRREATIFTPREFVFVEGVSLVADSIHGVHAGTDSRYAVGLRDITAFTYRSRGRGFIDGLGLGASLGFVLGAVTYRGENTLFIDRGLAAALGAIAGGLWGIVLGSTVGSTKRYELLPDCVDPGPC